MDNSKPGTWLVRHPLPPLLPSAVLYAACLPFDAFCRRGSCSGSSGFGILLTGALGIGLTPANTTWVANPILFAAWLATHRNWKTLGVLLSFVALMVGLSFMHYSTVVTDESGSPLAITGYRIGYWLWLASMAASCIGASIGVAIAPPSVFRRLTNRKQ
jgi:hypothetical protein